MHENSCWLSISCMWWNWKYPDNAPISVSDCTNYWLIVVFLLVITCLLLLMAIFPIHYMKYGLSIPWLFHNLILKYDISESIDIYKISYSRECRVCHYWYIFKISFIYQPYNGCHDVLQNSTSFYDAVGVTVKNSGCEVHIWLMDKC